MPDIDAAVKQVSREGMADHVRSDAPESGPHRCIFENSRDCCGSEMSLASRAFELVLGHQFSKSVPRLSSRQILFAEIGGSSVRMRSLPRIIDPVGTPNSAVPVNTAYLLGLRLKKRTLFAAAEV